MNTKLKNRIVHKYKNLSRFSAISSIPYTRLYRVVNYGTQQEVDEILELLNKMDDRALRGEVSEELIGQVKSKLKDIKNIKIWCLENGVSKYWLDQFLEKKTPFAGKRVARLKRILGI